MSEERQRKRERERETWGKRERKDIKHTAEIMSYHQNYGTYDFSMQGSAQ